MLKAVVFLSVVAVIAYFLFYPWLKNRVNRKRIFRWFIAIYIIAIVASTLNAYFLN
ncbi:hypothetical protein [Pontibacter akesuensis]|uniref:Uncharacterized protein n=1 Tax=Pontibacter akesuensis TaxID=388950 RepID=A0A1I7JBU1_9BACT|nr:hypothetical protein [Pontibacter akesuensis]SFU82697.1 hypothetical protein SAMN04487941_2697 [Pontibacter akesuensis]